MEYADKEAIHKRVLAFAESKQGSGKYPFAFGYVVSMLTDAQLRTLDRYMTAEGFPKL